ALSLIDSIQIKATFGSNSKALEDEEFVERVIEQELSTEKWKEFDRDVFLTEIPELSTIKKEKERILELLDSEFPEEIMKGLELATEFSKSEFLSAARTAIASLLQIKMMFFPNMNKEEYLDKISSFFRTSEHPEPFEESLQLIWEYSAQKERKGNKKTHKEIIKSIKREKDSFNFDLEDKSKEGLLNQLISSIKKRNKNE
ncbi:MAG: hypothetical protein ACTSUR_00005, partial [Candidatus Heimdallarchaeaceae archaeon]